ncbi:MAG TPA: TMEM175 family protein [Terracidiphilus sp.]
MLEGEVRAEMVNLYNRIQGRSLERLAALSDGIFAVAMTLLVLDLHIPTAAQVHGEGELLGALASLGPQWVAYGMSFLTLGILWAGQQTQLNHIGEGTRDLTWIHLGFLFTITLLPLSTRLLAEFIHYRGALGIYWLNLLAAGAMLYWSWMYATRAGLVKADTPEEVRTSICRRVVIAQSLYAGGAALCFINTWVSIGAILLVQLNYAIALRWRRRKSG